MESPLGMFAVHRDHEPVLESQSGAGAAHSKTWRKFERLWPTRQRLEVRRSSAAFNASAGTKFVRFMESPVSVFRTHWDLELLTALSSVFSRFGDAQPPKGGTPYQCRFMESPHAKFGVQWELEPELG